jgi:hypothetical protein
MKKDMPDKIEDLQEVNQTIEQQDLVEDIPVQETIEPEVPVQEPEQPQIQPVKNSVRIIDRIW